MAITARQVVGLVETHFGVPAAPDTIDQYLAGGGTLILVSHSMYYVQKLCRHACWLRDGKVERYGDVFDVTQAYLAYHERKAAPVPARAEVARAGYEFSVLGVALNGVDTETPLPLEFGATLRVGIRIRSRDGRVPSVALGIVRADGTPVYGVGSEMDGATLEPGADGDYVGEVEFADLPLLPGSYTVRVHPLDPEGVRLFDTVERGIIVRGASREFGLVRLAHRWLPGAAARER